LLFGFVFVTGFFDGSVGFGREGENELEISEEDFVPFVKFFLARPIAVDLEAVHAAEVADDELAVDLGDATVPSGELHRSANDDIAIVTSSDHDDRLVEGVGG